MCNCRYPSYRHRYYHEPNPLADILLVLIYLIALIPLGLYLLIKRIVSDIKQKKAKKAENPKGETRPSAPQPIKSGRAFKRWAIGICSGHNLCADIA